MAREAWQDLKGDVQHALPLAQAKLLQGIQSYYAELDVQSKHCLLSLLQQHTLLTKCVSLAEHGMHAKQAWILF